MKKEERITTNKNKYETLHSHIARLSEEVVGMKKQTQWKRSRGGSTSNFAAHVMQNTFLATRVELKCWGCGGTSVERGSRWMRLRAWSVKIKTMIPNADLNNFNWELTDRDQGNFDIKIMVFLWFNESVTPHERKRVQLDIQRALAQTLVKIKVDFVRATLDTAPDKRPWNRAQAIFLSARMVLTSSASM